MKGREPVEQGARPAAAAIDRQSVKSVEKGRPARSIRFDIGKNIKGQKRHILVDTTGPMLHALVHSASTQDRDGGAMVMATLSGRYPFLLKPNADGGYQGRVFESAIKDIMTGVDVGIVKRCDHAKGFVRLPKRWLVARTLAWLNRCRRLAKEWACLNRKALAFPLLASIRLMVPRLGRNVG